MSEKKLLFWLSRYCDVIHFLEPPPVPPITLFKTSSGLKTTIFIHHLGMSFASFHPKKTKKSLSLKEWEKQSSARTHHKQRLQKQNIYLFITASCPCFRHPLNFNTSPTTSFVPVRVKYSNSSKTENKDVCWNNYHSWIKILTHAKLTASDVPCLKIFWVQN